MEEDKGDPGEAFERTDACEWWAVQADLTDGVGVLCGPCFSLAWEATGTSACTKAGALAKFTGV